MELDAAIRRLFPPRSMDVTWERPLLYTKISMPNGAALHVINLHLRAPRAVPVPIRVKVTAASQVEPGQRVSLSPPRSGKDRRWKLDCSSNNCSIANQTRSSPCAAILIRKSMTHLHGFWLEFGRRCSGAVTSQAHTTSGPCRGSSSLQCRTRRTPCAS